MPASADITEIKRTSAISIARNIVAGFFGLILCGVVIHDFLPSPHVSQVSKKLAYLRAHQNEFDTLFVGSSRFYHQIIPKEFDAKMAAAGHPTHSFNLGIDSMFPPESFYYLRQVLAAHPGKLKWVFFELMPLTNNGAFNKGETTKRLVYWHDWPDTWLSLRIVAASDKVRKRPLSLPEKVRDYARHLNLFFHNELNPGRLSDSLTAIFQPKETVYPPPWLGHRGCLIIDRPVTPADRKELIDGVAQFKSNPPSRVAPSPILLAGLQRAAREIRAAGATPIFITVPTLKRIEYLEDIHKHGLNVKVFSFNNPTKYPTLYEPKLHYDFFHLNKAGAPIFTRDLANQFAQWIDSSEKTNHKTR